MKPVRFFTAGIPAPEGSHKYVGHRGGRPIVAHDNPRLDTWRTLVTRDARTTARTTGWHTLHDGPVAVEAHFYLPRPKRPKFPDHAATKPDLDKLARAIGDALAAPDGPLSEDSRIVTWVLTKHWASASQPPGVHIIMTALND